MPSASSLSPVPGPSGLRRYLQWVRSIERLCPETERELAERYRDGDPSAGEQLVLANLRVVIQVAMRYHSEMATTLDLIQEGNMGLLRALDKFDPSLGKPFSAYARYWVRAMIVRFVMENHRLVNVGRTRASRRLFFELARERAQIAASGAPESTALLADRLGIDCDEAEQILNVLQREESLDCPPEGHSGYDVLRADIGDPEHETGRKEMQAAVRRATEQFAASVRCERERALLDERLLAGEPRGLAALGDRFGLTKERMRQIEARLKDRLGQHLVAALGAEVRFAA